MIRIIIFLLLFLLANLIQAQFYETNIADRPEQAIGPFSVGKYIFQTQTGFDMGGFNENKIDFSNYNLVPNTVLRFGITETIELNSGLEYRYDHLTIMGESAYFNSLSGVTIGSRIHLYERKKIVAAIGLQLGLSLPLLSEPYDSKYIAPKIMLIASNNINKISLF